MSEDIRHRPPRVRTAINAVVLAPDGADLPVQVVDLSGSGFRLHGGGGLSQGASVQLRVSRYGDFAAEILWVKGEEAGGRFLEPVTL